MGKTTVGNVEFQRYVQSSFRIQSGAAGVYVSVALLWLWLVEGASPDRWDLVDGAMTLAGMAIIAFAPRG